MLITEIIDKTANKISVKTFNKKPPFCSVYGTPISNLHKKCNDQTKSQILT
jgi:hypothetical protein